jgi:hypothetical protein
MFARKPKKRTVTEGGSRRSGWFHMFWERQPMPDPGAMNYSYESLGLAPFTPIGPSVTTRQPINPISERPLPYYNKAVVLNGIPTTSGTMVLSPLYDPNAGYTNMVTPLGVLPFDKHGQLPAGEVI